MNKRDPNEPKGHSPLIQKILAASDAHSDAGIADELRRASVRVRLKGLSEAADLMNDAADRLSLREPTL